MLSCISESRSLRAAVISNRQIYSTFVAASISILDAVFCNEFPPGLRPDAVAAIESKQIPVADADAIRAFLSDHEHTHVSRPERWSFSDSLAATKFHEDVRYFAAGFAATVAVYPFTQSTEESRVVFMKTEMERVEQALYRYELYCNLFRHEVHKIYGSREPVIQSRERRKIFFDKFAPWENEHFYTIYEHLWFRLSEGMRHSNINLHLRYAHFSSFQ